MGRPGARGHRYRTARKAVLAHSTTCWICLHDGADQVDHVQPRSLNPDIDDADTTNLMSVHGVNGCPTCGLKCNQSRGNGTVTRPIRSRDW
jgi:5-methylcytosine-specific restriction endonuclease McrA